jgi:hypothetical protein
MELSHPIQLQPLVIYPSQGQEQAMANNIRNQEASFYQDTQNLPYKGHQYAPDTSIADAGSGNTTKYNQATNLKPNHNNHLNIGYKSTYPKVPFENLFLWTLFS